MSRCSICCFCVCGKSPRACHPGRLCLFFLFAGTVSLKVVIVVEFHLVQLSVMILLRARMQYDVLKLLLDVQLNDASRSHINSSALRLFRPMLKHTQLTYMLCNRDNLPFFNQSQRAASIKESQSRSEYDMSRESVHWSKYS